jgi:prolipoprotein diacylglyceryltransferase
MGDISIASWDLMILVAAIVSGTLSVYLKPKDFVLKRWEIATMVLAIMYMGLIGGNVLFRILHNGSDAGGFAYFGTLTFSLITIWVCAKIKKVKFLTLADYGLP